MVDYDELALQWRLADLAIVSTFSFLFITVHPLLQTTAGKLLRLQTRRAVVGSGTTLRRFTVLGATWEFKPLPLSSVILATASGQRWYRIRNMMVTALGPMLHIVLLTLLAEHLVLPSLTDVPTSYGVHVGFDLLAANIVALAMSIWPRMIRSDTTMIPNDGLRLWRLLVMGKKELYQEISYGYAYDACDLVLQHDLEGARRIYEEGLRLAPTSSTLLVGYANVMADLGAAETARTILLDLLATPGLHQWIRASALNALACQDLLSERPELLSEADNCSLEAYWSYPWHSYFIGTRGAVLARKGNLDEGEVLLKQAIESNDDERIQSDLHCHLGYIQLIRGDEQKAREHFEIARTLFPRNRLLDR